MYPYLRPLDASPAAAPAPDRRRRPFHSRTPPGHARGHAWEADSASNGEEALTQLEGPRENRSYDVVLADILMPGMDGLTLLGRLRVRYPDIPVVIMTVKNTPEHVLGSLRREAAAYIGKPFSRDALLTTLQNALSVSVTGDDIKILSDKPNWISLQISPSSCVNCPAIWIPICANRSRLLSANCS